ncbi:MAG TPA: hypothetical protein VKA46_01015 [Gemmataceae bacterium]|nr:hypothetical protein [Gemmataceae bacterium]
MPLEDVLALLRRRPFVPFVLHLTDGTSHEVRHPEMLMPGARSLVLGIPGDPAVPVYARTETIALVHVVRLQPLEETPTTSNGQH